MSVSPTFSPWTSRPSFKGLGLPTGKGRKRVVDLIDLVAVQICKKSRTNPANPVSLEKCVQNTIVDISQSHSRPTYSNTWGTAKCLCTGSTLYSYQFDRVLSAKEHLLLQGHHAKTRVPPTVSDSELRRMCGESIALPCLGALVWAVALSAGFPAAMRSCRRIPQSP